MAKVPGPTVLGLAPSFGFGDRLGVATLGHVAALRRSGRGIKPIFAQQSIREMTRTVRTPQQVMDDALHGAASAGYIGEQGADADHLKTPEDVDRTAAAGFCFFTIDPSEFVSNQADRMNLQELEAAVKQLESDKIFGDRSWREFYLEREFEVSERLKLRFTKEHLYRAAVKYGRAIHHSEIMGR